MSGLNFAGEFSLKEMKLLTSAGVVIDIRKMTQSIEIFENIMHPSLTGNISLLDIDNVIEKLRTQNQTWIEKRGAAEIGDKLHISYRGLIDNEEFEGGVGR